MPNATFCKELKKAAKELYDLHAEVAAPAVVKARL